MKTLTKFSLIVFAMLFLLGLVLFSSCSNNEQVLVRNTKDKVVSIWEADMKLYQVGDTISGDSLSGYKVIYRTNSVYSYN